ncbi:MAG: HNH endonuclease signature motif containing protein, partial [Actinobacteria bacterium]|nr:HNH endonuclease signature motif containing protein [Actinomycetota bacterium]
TYRVPDALRAFIEARDRTCRFPGCHRRAGLAQIDHAIPWDRGGATSRENLGALCTRHHQLKTHAGWAITASTFDGSCRWRSPSGFGYERLAAPFVDPHPRSPDADRSADPARSTGPDP